LQVLSDIRSMAAEQRDGVSTRGVKGLYPTAKDGEVYALTPKLFPFMRVVERAFER
jgi:hypothetical protein